MKLPVNQLLPVESKLLVATQHKAQCEALAKATGLRLMSARVVHWKYDCNRDRETGNDQNLQDAIASVNHVKRAIEAVSAEDAYKFLVRQGWNPLAAGAK